MNTIARAIAGLVVLYSVAVARGQGYSTIGTQPSPIMPGHHASTAAESALRGAADLEQAHGAMLLNRSQAAVNLQEAQRREVENRQARIKAYFELREQNRQARAAERSRRPNQVPAQTLAVTKRPSSPIANPLDAGGLIQWPLALAGTRFAAQRRLIDQLVQRQRLGQTWVTSDRQCLQAACRSMLDELKPLAREVSAKEYFVAVKFLQTLPAALPSDSNVVTAVGQQS